MAGAVSVPIVAGAVASQPIVAAIGEHLGTIKAIWEREPLKRGPERWDSNRRMNLLKSLEVTRSKRDWLHARTGVEGCSQDRRSLRLVFSFHLAYQVLALAHSLPVR